MKIQPLIAVRDVPLSSQWYCQLLGCRSGHGGRDYDQLFKDDDPDFFMQLHAWNAHDHPNLGDPHAAPHGYGVLLWFLVEDFSSAVARARAMNAPLVQGPQVNSRANHRECWLRDPDDYIVVLASAYGDMDKASSGLAQAGVAL